MSPEEFGRALEALRSRLAGRAAGAWRAEGARLVLVAFAPAPDLPDEVARGFEAATTSVDLGMLGLGIVRAFTTGEASVSIARDLPADHGSGLWLRAFGADRSVAVPILAGDGRPVGVVSVAIGPGPEPEAVASAIRLMARVWDPTPPAARE